MTFLEVPKKRRYYPNRHNPDAVIHLRIPPLLKAKLRSLAFQRRTTISKIIRAYIRYCLEKKEGLEVELPLEDGCYWREWMRE